MVKNLLEGKPEGGERKEGLYEGGWKMLKWT
jgi:hypothetical protein